MKVLKFGGTSVGSPERMHSVASLILDGSRKIVVLSAVSGTTNALVEISACCLKNDLALATKKTEELKAKYIPFVDTLLSTADGKKAGIEIVDEIFTLIKNKLTATFTVVEERILLAQGELLSTRLFTAYLIENKKNAVLLPALDFMLTDSDSEPVVSYTEQKLGDLLNKYSDTELFITQGYICKNSNGEIDNLKRGGSDYTATLVGAAIRASEIQIWTDIDGMHNNDPRIVKRTYPIAELSFDEAAELAYFGAKILHPTCIRPASDFNIPVRLLNTMAPKEKGTVIANKTTESNFKAVAAKDGITAINIKSSRMLLAYGFLRKVFEIFEKYKTSIDMITTSEVAVSVTIDEAVRLPEILTELNQFATTEVDYNQTIICIVGNFVAEKPGLVKRIFDSLEHIPVRMIAYGGSEHNVSVLVNTQDKNAALNAINEGIFFSEPIVA